MARALLFCDTKTLQLVCCSASFLLSRLVLSRCIADRVVAGREDVSGVDGLLDRAHGLLCVHVHDLVHERLAQLAHAVVVAHGAAGPHDGVLQGEVDLLELLGGVGLAAVVVSIPA